MKKENSHIEDTPTLTTIMYRPTCVYVVCNVCVGQSIVVWITKG